MRKNLIIIDLDDTLFTTFYRKYIAFQELETLYSIDLELNENKVLNCFGFEAYISKFNPKALSQFNKEQINKMSKDWFDLFVSVEIFKKYLKMKNSFEFARETADYLKKAHYKSTRMSNIIGSLSDFDIIYLSGRPDWLYDCSIEELRQYKFPLPNDDNIRLILKKNGDSDIDYKNKVLSNLDLNSILCIFEDNEEIIQNFINIFKKEGFPVPPIYQNLPPYRPTVELNDSVISDLDKFERLLIDIAKA